MKNNNYYDDEEYYGRRDKSRNKKSRHKKSQREAWAELEMEEEEEYEAYASKSHFNHFNDDKLKQVKPREVPAEAILEIKKKDGSTKIDLTRVDAVDCVDGVINAQGKQTYGVKFIYSGNKGYGYTQWFGTNKFNRDKSYEEWHNKWLEVASNK